MTPSALGPAGIHQRMQEIQDKMREVFGDSTDYSEFKNTLSQAGNRISGNMPDGFGPVGSESYSAVGMGPSPLQQMAIDAAQRNGIDPQLYTSLINQESSFNPNATSSVGAAGLAQLMPGTASSLGVKNPYDPVQSLEGGAKYFAQLLDQFGSPQLALAAYNAGPGAVIKANGIPENSQTQNYVKKIMSAYEANSKP